MNFPFDMSLPFTFTYLPINKLFDGASGTFTTLGAPGLLRLNPSIPGADHSAFAQRGLSKYPLHECMSKWPR